MCDNEPTDVGQQNLEQIAIARSTPEVQLAAMAKYNLRLLIITKAGQVAGATAAAALANANAANAQAVAQAAGNADRFRLAAPPKYENKKKDAHVRQWIPVIEDYLRTAPDADYIRLASSYLEGGSRSLWTSVYIIL
jgi:predicted TIM-barrel fold metal-dependent hydrolase